MHVWGIETCLLQSKLAHGRHKLSGRLKGAAAPGPALPRAGGQLRAALPPRCAGAELACPATWLLLQGRCWVRSTGLLSYCFKALHRLLSWTGSLCYAAFARFSQQCWWLIG